MTATMGTRITGTLSWVSIIRLGLVQMALGAIVVLTTATLNRLMVVEYALPAVLPGFLVALHYGVQITRPKWGFQSDTGGKRSPWIMGGVVTLGLGAILATFGVFAFDVSFWLGLAVSLVAYVVIGLGVGAGGTSLLAFLATYTAERRRPAAASITWLMMIFGIALTAGVAGTLLDPFSPGRLVSVVTGVAVAASLMTSAALFGLEKRHGGGKTGFRTLTGEGICERAAPSFWMGMGEIWQERRTRHFALFVFLSMTAYFMQELILEPYGGLVFGLSLGQSTALSGTQHGGVFLGMLTVGLAATGLKLGSLRFWVITGCLGSAAALLGLTFIGQMGNTALLSPAVAALGFANGAFAVAAIGSMMELAGSGRATREGTRMGLWGAAQAIAAGFGGLFGAASVDLMRQILTSTADAFGAVFLLEAMLFCAAAALATQVMKGASPAHDPGTVRAGLMRADPPFERALSASVTPSSVTPSHFASSHLAPGD